MKLEQLSNTVSADQVSDHDIIEFAQLNSWEDADLESFIKCRDLGEYIIPEKLVNKNTLGQCIVVVKIEILKKTPFSQNLLVHSPTMGLPKWKLIGGKQNTIDREVGREYNLPFNNYSIITALREATEELESSKINCYYKINETENTYLIYDIKRDIFEQTTNVRFPALFITQTVSHAKSMPDISQSRYKNVQQHRWDIHVVAELYDPAQDIELSKPIRNGRLEEFKWIPMTADVANHLNKKMGLISQHTLSNATEIMTNGSLPVYPSHEMSLLDWFWQENSNFSNKKSLASVIQKFGFARDTKEDCVEGDLRSSSDEGQRITKPHQSRDGIRNLMRPYSTRYGKKSKDNNKPQRYRYFLKKRSDLSNSFRKLEALLIHTNREKHDGPLKGYSLKNIEEDTTDLIVSQISQSKNLDAIPQMQKNWPFIRKKKHNDKQKFPYFGQVLARHGYAYYLMKTIDCPECGKSIGEPCNVESLGKLPSTGELALIWEENNTNPEFKENHRISDITKPTDEMVSEMNQIYHKISSQPGFEEYAKFQYIIGDNKSKNTKQSFIRPFTCPARSRRGQSQPVKSLLKLIFPLNGRSEIENQRKRSSRLSSLYLPWITEPSPILQINADQMIRRLLTRLSSAYKNKGDDKNITLGGDRFHIRESNCFLLEMLGNSSDNTLSSIPIDKTPYHNEIKVPVLQINQGDKLVNRFSKTEFCDYVSDESVANYRLSQSSRFYNWSFKSGTNLPIISIESNMNEALCAAVMHGEGVAIAIDRWWLDENSFPNINYNSLEDRRWKFTEDLFVEEERQLRGSRTFTSFYATLLDNKLTDIERKYVFHERRIIGVLKLDSLIEHLNSKSH